MRRINISLDTLNPGRFRHLTRNGDLDRVLAGGPEIDTAVQRAFEFARCRAGGDPDDDPPRQSQRRRPMHLAAVGAVRSDLGLLPVDLQRGRFSAQNVIAQGT